MQNKKCVCCGVVFQPRAQTPTQSFCSEPACQRTRRKLWNRNKLRNDPDYRENKARSQRAWQEINTDYWRKYRQNNPEYAERNRNRQRQKRSRPDELVAKIDASSGLTPGLYWIEPISSGKKEISGIWKVRITPVGYK